jgi:hypothetical protein
MVADCWVFVDVGRFYLQSNTARIMPITLTKNRITYFSGLTNLNIGRLPFVFCIFRIVTSGVKNHLLDLPIHRVSAINVGSVKRKVHYVSERPK